MENELRQFLLLEASRIVKIGGGPVHPIKLCNEDVIVNGITLRNHFAGLAMQGWLAGRQNPTTTIQDLHNIATLSVGMADALIYELLKEKKSTS
jgi:hypothetical protein